MAKTINAKQNKVSVARTKNDFKTGMSQGTQNTMVFPFSVSGEKQMTMKPKGKKAIKEPLAYQGFTNGELTDYGVAMPGMDFTVNGDTVVEHRLPKAQLGGNFEPAIPYAPGFMGQNLDLDYPENALTGPLDKVSTSKPTPSWSFTPKHNNVKDIEFPWITTTTPKAAPKPRPIFNQPNTKFLMGSEQDNLALDKDLGINFSPSTPTLSPSGNLNSNPSTPKTIPVNTQLQATQSTPKGSTWAGDFSNMTPGDIVQNTPLNASYNLGKYLFTKAEKEAPIRNEYANRALGIKQHLTAATDNMPIRIQDKAAKQFINDNVSSASGRIANLLQQDANTSEAYRKNAFDVQAANNQYAGAYADALNNEGAVRAQENLRTRIANQEHKAKHDDYLGHAVREYDNNLQNLGKTMNQARQNQIELNTLNSKRGDMFLADKYGNITFTEAGKKYWADKGVTDVNEAKFKQSQLDKQQELELAKANNNVNIEPTVVENAGKIPADAPVNSKFKLPDGTVIIKSANNRLTKEDGSVYTPPVNPVTPPKALGGYTSRVKAYLDKYN
jgi:hypothetical protein